MEQRFRSIALTVAFCVLIFEVQVTDNASVFSPGKYRKFMGDQGLYKRVDDVEILTVNNFKDAIIGSNRSWLVKFYSSWCGFCQRFAPSWKEFATEVRGWNDLVAVAVLDCSNDENHALCRDYEIMTYPSLRYYHENFHEEAKSYGATIDRGVTASDHKRDLLHKIISEQREGRGKHYPNMLPYTENNTENIFDKPSQEYAILVIQDPESVLGAELALDLHKISSVTVRYAYSDNTILISSLPSKSVPSLMLIEKGKDAINLKPSSNTKQDMLEAIKQSLESKNILFDTVKEKTYSELSNKDENNSNDDGLLIEKARSMGDTIFQMDLETALRYSLKREIGGYKELSGEKLAALKKYLHVLNEYFPFGGNGKKLLSELEKYATSDDVIEGKKIAQMVKDAEKEDRRVFSTPQKWLGCRGSSPTFRGYPCGLWKMFHYLTVNVAANEPDLRGDNPRLALEAMHGYIKNFFGCADCSQHFQDMATRREIDKVSSFDKSILWLWAAHNEVNRRLSKDATEDPEFPKIQFPSETSCSKCRKSDGEWDNDETLKYLRHMYGRTNISFLGADTSVIFLGSQGNARMSMGILNFSGSVGLDFLLYMAVFIAVFVIINMFLKRGYRRKIYRYKADLLGKV